MGATDLTKEYHHLLLLLEEGRVVIKEEEVLKLNLERDGYHLPEISHILFRFPENSWSVPNILPNEDLPHICHGHFLQGARWEEDILSHP